MDKELIDKLLGDYKGPEDLIGEQGLLKEGFPQAVETVFPQAQVQLCIVHVVRASLNYVSWRERKSVAEDFKSVYSAATEEEATREMAAFAERWNPKYAPIVALWRRNRDRVIPCFAFPPRSAR